MPRHAIGTRVGAVVGAEEGPKIIEIFGYGTYEGDKQPPPDVIFCGVPYPEGLTNPAIKLDNGDTVFGCECWWGPEDKIKHHIEQYSKAKYKVQTITVAEYRRRGKEMLEKASEGEDKGEDE